MIRLVELKGPNENILLVFLRELERRKMIWSRLEKTESGGMERIWYGFQSSVSRGNEK